MTVKLNIRLPDIHDFKFLDERFNQYGRCALLTDGSFWFGNIKSSHPANTKEGFYWAVDLSKNLYISPRGASLGFEKYLSEDFLSFLIENIKV
jgi:hypothetical protein